MDLHCFISIENVLTEIKTREIKEETYKNKKKKISLSSVQENVREQESKRKYSLFPQLRWCCRVCCSCSYSESPRRLFSKIAQILLMQVLLENTLYLLGRLGHREFMRR